MASVLVGDASTFEGRHAGMACGGGFDDAGGKCRTRAFAKTHAERQKRRLAELFDRLQMPGLCRNMADQAMIERRRIGSLENGGRSRRDITIDDHGDAFHARGKDSAGHGGDLAPAETAQDFKRIGEVIAMQCDRLLDGGNLALQHLALGAGSRSDPVLCLTAIKRVMDGGGDRGVADAHFADAEQIRAAGDRLHAEGHGRSAVTLAERRLFGDVGSRKIERQIEDLETEVVGDADLVDRSSAGSEILHHLLRDGQRERRNSLLGDAVIAGEDRNQRPGHGRRAAGPGGKPEGDLFETAERAGRFGELRVALARRHERAGVWAWKVAQQRAEIVEWQAGYAHECRSLSFGLKSGSLRATLLVFGAGANNSKSVRCCCANSGERKKCGNICATSRAPSPS
ncbi:hypothetical protein RHSP_29741 [Rhizobium freirei PRF 81]|uniref:Uncharacterized protein n=1 Tax=Rhizobium freirei PRF 81 TaxID=363754 RepID=N6VDY1_9HYPH|nr:hypothetical protein RHSP_29741 [Rhizobium freirei PRF 81]